jgi:hypothetical protein
MTAKTIPLGFLTAFVVVSSAHAQQTSERFGRWDANKDGKVTREEIPLWFKDAFNEIDANQDGVITPDEELKFRPTSPPGPSARIPDTIRVASDLPYAATDNPKQRLDLL